MKRAVGWAGPLPEADMAIPPATSITVALYGCWHSAPAAWLICSAELRPMPQIGDFYEAVGYDALVLCQVCGACESSRGTHWNWNAVGCSSRAAWQVQGGWHYRVCTCLMTHGRCMQSWC